MAGTFEAQISRWVAATAQRVEAVVKESAQRVISEMTKPRGEGGRMRVDTGYLRASGQASTAAMPTINRAGRPALGATYAYSASPIALVIAGSRLGQPIYFGFTASYAAAREYGANGQPPDAFVRGAAQKWRAIVNQVGREAQARAGGRRR